MTIGELEAERAKILKAMSKPEDLRSGDDAVRFRPVQDYVRALAAIDAEIAKLQGADGRTFTIQTCRGI